jgi:hypothetical protein
MTFSITESRAADAPLDALDKSTASGHEMDVEPIATTQKRYHPHPDTHSTVPPFLPHPDSNPHYDPSSHLSNCSPEDPPHSSFRCNQYCRSRSNNYPLLSVISQCAAMRS